METGDHKWFSTTLSAHVSLNVTKYIYKDIVKINTVYAHENWFGEFRQLGKNI